MEKSLDLLLDKNDYSVNDIFQEHLEYLAVDMYFRYLEVSNADSASVIRSSVIYVSNRLFTIIHSVVSFHTSCISSFSVVRTRCAKATTIKLLLSCLNSCMLAFLWFQVGDM